MVVINIHIFTLMTIIIILIFFCHLPYLCLVITLNVVPRTKTKNTGLGNLELGCVLISMYNPHRVKLIITKHCAPTVAECSQQMVETKRSH